MKKFRFAIIGPDTENTRDLTEEIKETAHSFAVLKFSDITIEFTRGNFHAFWKNKNLDIFDIFILRGYNKNLLFAQIIVQNLLRKNKVVIDETIGRRFISSKAYEASVMAEKKIAHPQTYQAVGRKAYERLLARIRFPIIAKPIYGQKGQDIQKITSHKEFLEFFAKNPKGYIFQEFFEIDGDIRVLVVNNKALGAMKRYLVPGDFRSNASLGAKAEKIPLTKELKKLAVEATRAMNYEIAGVDIINHKNKLYVLEINSAPQWQTFKAVTGINPAKHIIKYALEKFARKAL